MRTIFNLLLMASLLSLAGCKKWLDVSPQTQVREEKLLITEQGFKEALLGTYIALTSGNAYGQSMTMGFMDALAQRYNTSSTSHIFNKSALYQYSSDTAAKGYISRIWGSLYTGIGNVDNILLQIDDQKSVFMDNNYNLVKGEALGLRALLHFDLLRCFGAAPVVDGNRKAIPYVTRFGISVYPLLTVNQVMDSCLKDLAAAEQLLSVDKTLRNDYANDPFLSYTRNHMNYWAVKGLQARIYLYKGDKTAAMAAAQEVITNGASLFPFVTATAAAATANRDKAYANELLFSLSAYKINDYVNAYFKTTATNGTPTLSTTSANLTALYETTSGGSSDIRFNYLFTLYASGYSSTKYWQDDYVVNVLIDYLTKLVPMIRLSEMYYIAAECAATPADGVAYINKVRANRGLAALPTTLNQATLDAEILKEYKKEMYAEGQLFFYFKRKNVAKVDGSNTVMNDGTWIFPLPESEVEFGKRF